MSSLLDEEKSNEILKCELMSLQLFVENPACNYEEKLRRLSRRSFELPIKGNPEKPIPI